MLTPIVLLALAVAAVVGLALPAVRRLRDLELEVGRLSGHVEELAGRLGAAEQDAARALGAAEVAGNVLVEKGVADEEDLESARTRSGLSAGSGHVPERDGELH